MIRAIENGFDLLTRTKSSTENCLLTLFFISAICTFWVISLPNHIYLLVLQVPNTFTSQIL
ncbi:hypothetical protein I79_007460 [Cricetulus griseus]|uniref:Uncharacterized protein n=1 Tax=Cricetulus griseus TaxID=10029 RepID=G3HAK4_CRIGR|nr:hypothetical protein I79_026177 [Cricetulus griseus]EGV92681.1 hypothetical protein I79_007460 [Cricetulus griseus]